eukprot:120799_1
MNVEIYKPTKEGYLQKQSAVLKIYRKRWMVLQESMLYSFKERKKYDKPTEVFDLKIYNVKKSQKGKPTQFKLVSNTLTNGSRNFIASSKGEMEDWIKYIQLSYNKIGNDGNNHEEKKGHLNKYKMNSENVNPANNNNNNASKFNKNNDEKINTPMVTITENNANNIDKVSKKINENNIIITHDQKTFNDKKNE